MPTQGTCPGCGKLLSWVDALKSSGNVGWKNSRTKKRRASLFQKLPDILPPLKLAEDLKAYTPRAQQYSKQLAIMLSTYAALQAQEVHNQ